MWLPESQAVMIVISSGFSHSAGLPGFGLVLGVVCTESCDVNHLWVSVMDASTVFGVYPGSCRSNLLSSEGLWVLLAFLIYSCSHSGAKVHDAILHTLLCPPEWELQSSLPPVCHDPPFVFLLRSQGALKFSVTVVCNNGPHYRILILDLFLEVECIILLGFARFVS